MKTLTELTQDRALTKPGRWRRAFGGTKRAAAALVLTPTLILAALVPIALALGIPTADIWKLVLTVAGTFLLPAPVVLFLGFSSDVAHAAVDEIQQRQTIKTREKLPAAGAMSMVEAGGELSPTGADDES